MDNSLLNIFLILVATVGVMSALFVVVQTNVFRAAISLALSFISVAVVYFAINAEFLGAVQILVYVWAVSVLMAFSVLLVKDLQTASSSTKGFSFYTSLFISGLIFATFTYVILATNWITVENIKSPIVEQILFEEYVENSNDNSITSVSNTSLESEIKEGIFNNSILPIGTLLSTKYFVSLQLIGLIIVACVIGSIAVTKNTIENDQEGNKETV